ncbi:MAG TPA: trehalose-phosphatase [Polyangia bacterium]
MKNILTGEHASTLLAFAHQRVLLAFDFDGTLAPIVRKPEAAAMRRRTTMLLAELARHYPCAVISGRSRADVMKKVEEIPLRALFGNHGMEPSPNPRAWRRLAARWQAQLAAALPTIPGMVIENKGVSLAIHYRLARARGAVRRLVLQAAADLHGTRIVEGKMVVNVLPAGGPDKGTALVSLRKRLRCQCAVYIGDDDTDEDVFALAKQERLLGIRVGRSRRTQAAYYVPSQTAIDRLLRKLVDARQSQKTTKRARPSKRSRRPGKLRRAA